MASINSTVYGTNKAVETMLTTQEVKDRLMIKDKHVFARLIREGLPHIKIGRRYLIPQSKFERWLANQ